MSRRFNYTGRRRLTRDHFSIRILEEKEGRPPSFSAQLAIPAEMKLDAHARIYIEAYVGNSVMRFDFGTVAAVLHPDDCVLTDIDAGTPILFRVRIVDESKSVGRILAAANGIRPESDKEGQNRRSLLPLRSLDLGEEMWRLEIDKDAGPTLAVNNRIPGFSDKLPSDSLLKGLIYPEVVRQMARALWADESDFDENDNEWVRDWRGWLAQQLGKEITSDDYRDAESLDALASEIASAFSNRNRFASKVAAVTGEL